MRSHLHFLQRFYALLLSLVLIFTDGTCALAYQEPFPGEKQMRTHHVGQTVIVRQADGTVLRAKIISLDESTVDLRPSKGRDVTIAYQNLKSVKEGGLSKRAKIWIVVGVVFIALGVIGTRV